MLRWMIPLALMALPAGAAAPVIELQDSTAAPVLRGQSLIFPRDYGSHGQFRTEWWYVTGWLQSARGPLGFQITFFRSRTPRQLVEGNPSAFTPAQLIIGHAALSDPSLGRLRQEQRVARAGLGLAGADEHDTRVWLDDWKLVRDGEAYRTSMRGEEFSFDLELRAAQPPMPNGDRGFSQKGPDPKSASFYYSIPHLAVRGNLLRGNDSIPVTGEAWLDHEWSSEYLDPTSAGWDWLGLNLDDGAALMAFRIRGKDGATRWSGATLRDARGAVQVFLPEAVRFSTQRSWQSPRTGIQYPVQWSVVVGEHRWQLQPLMEDQENDTRATTGAIYWEGAVRAFKSEQIVGRGYLELTGYGDPLRLR